MSILEEIQQTIQNSGGPESTDLNLSELEIGKITPEIKKTIEKCKKLEILLMVNCNLTTLDNLPDLDLHAIDLTANNLGDKELQKLTKYKNLGQIIFNENKITKVDSIRHLAKLEKLEEVDFTDNPVTKEENYKESVWETLPNLEVLDRFDREGNQHLEEEEEEFQDDGESGEEDFDEDEDNQEDYDDEEDQSEEEGPKKKKK